MMNEAAPDHTITHDAEGYAAGTIEDVRGFLRQRNSYMQKLKDELTQSEARTSEIRQLLTELGGIQPSNENGHQPAVRTEAHGASVPELITSLLRANTKMSIGSLVKAIKGIRPDVKPSTIYPAVYRMSSTGRVKSEGTRNRRVYSLPAERK